MTLIVLLAGFGLFCVLLWNFAVYALPAFVGFSAGWWALNHGAGAGSLAVGLVAGVALFLFGRHAVAHQNAFLRCAALAVFVVPAAYAGFCIVNDLSPEIDSTWKALFAVVGALSVGSTTYVRLTTAILPPRS